MTSPRCNICKIPATKTVIKALVTRGIYDHHSLICPICREKILDEAKAGKPGQYMAAYEKATGRTYRPSPDLN